MDIRYTHGYTSLHLEERSRILAQRRYELPDHLGNVHVSLSDRKQESKVINDIMTYLPQTASFTDYYPFGFPMPQRSKYLQEYRYGFNGQEMDNEVYGEGASYTAEFWQYDARLGRRWNVDPIQHPSLSSYSSFANNPISYSDQLGLDTIFKTVDGIETQRNPGGEEDVWIIEQLPPVEVKPAPTGNMQDNPYREGSLPWQVFNRNISNPNLWNNRSTFSWAGSGQSQWIRDFNRGFGTLLLVGMTGPLAGEALGALAVGTVKTAAAVPTFISNVSYYSQYAAWRTYSTYKAVTSSQLYFSTLAYMSKILGIMEIQLVAGGFLGYTAETYSYNISPDFTTGIFFFDLGVQSGSLIFWYEKEIKKMYYNYLKNEENNSK